MQALTGVAPPMPLPRYVDALLDIWTEGPIRSPKKARGRS